jgi:malonyl-CoA decarboxylase
MANKASSSFINRTLKRVRNRWSEIGSNPKEKDDLHISPGLTDKELKEIAKLIDQSLTARGGEVSARSIAARIGRAYMTLNNSGKEKFFRLLATQYDVDDKLVSSALLDYQQAGKDSDLPQLRHRLRNILLAPRVKLLTLFNALPEGIKFLVDMRADILALGSESDPDLRKVEKDLKHLLSSWFDVGFLRLMQITWDSPTSLLEKLIEYEAVHEISSWDDLKHRLAEDRRLFAFFHPNMPNEPLIFVNVAFLRGLATNIQTLLDTNAPLENIREADTAIFYSISNAQAGLAGIGFGNFLIKRVVSEVKTGLPQLRQFATLSPIPGFRKWLDSQLADPENDLLRADEKKAIDKLATSLGMKNSLPAILKSASWSQNEKICRVMEPALKRLCAVYLTTQHESQRRLLDPVAHFHISNGAIMKQLDWLGNTSTAGMAQSYGMMINYLYALNTIDQNSEHYSNTHEAAVSKEIKQLLVAEKK